MAGIKPLSKFCKIARLHEAAPGSLRTLQAALAASSILPPCYVCLRTHDGTPLYQRQRTNKAPPCSAEPRTPTGMRTGMEMLARP